MQENITWMYASLKKRLTIQGNKPNQVKSLWLGLILFFLGYFSTFLWKIGWHQPVSYYNGGLMRRRFFRHFNHQWHVRFLCQAIIRKLITYRPNHSEKNWYSGCSAISKSAWIFEKYVKWFVYLKAKCVWRHGKLWPTFLTFQSLT